MKFQRCVWVCLAAALLLSSLATAKLSAFPPRGGYVTPGAEGLYYYRAPMYSYYYFNPYVMPLPGYGILPPLASTYQYYGHESQSSDWFRTAEDYGYTPDRFESPPRKRTALHPAVPFERSPEVRLADLRRVRFEITVPYADAIVQFDGAKTKQTGLKRVFVTPPMQEDKDYSVTIVVQWLTNEGALSSPRQKTFTVVAGETVQHTFIE